MKQIDEIALMAYADGELDSEEALEVARAIGADANLRAQVDRYRRSTELIREAYGPIAEESCPTSMLAAIRGFPDPVKRVGVNMSWSQRRWLPLAASIAAVAAIGALILSLLGPTPNGRDNFVATGPGEQLVPRPGGSGQTESSDSRASSPEDARTQDVIKIGAPAPDIAFTSVDGRAYHLSEFRGRSVMLWLFATWCRTCRAATVAVVENYDQLHQAGLQIIQLKLYENLGYLGPTTKEFAARYVGPLALEPGWLWGDASKEGSFTYDPKGYPDIYFLIDKDGIVREVAPAPNVTMDKILAFAKSSSGDEGS